MQDSLPAAGPALPGGIGYPQGSCERFHGCNVSPFPSFLARCQFIISVDNRCQFVISGTFRGRSSFLDGFAGQARFDQPLGCRSDHLSGQRSTLADWRQLDFPSDDN